MSIDSVDQLDFKILLELEQNARLSNAEIGRRVGLSAPAVGERIRSLEERGVIRGYRAIVNKDALGLPMEVFVRLTAPGHVCAELHKHLPQFAQIVEAYRLTGDDSAIIRVAVRSISELEQFIDQLGALGKPSSALVLSTLVEPRTITSRLNRH